MLFILKIIGVILLVIGLAPVVFFLLVGCWWIFCAIVNGNYYEKKLKDMNEGLPDMQSKEEYRMTYLDCINELNQVEGALKNLSEHIKKMKKEDTDKIVEQLDFFNTKITYYLEQIQLLKI